MIRVYYRGDKEVDEEYVLKTMSYAVNSGVAIVTFTQEMNSLNDELPLMYEYLRRKREVRAVVWTGFSAGAEVEIDPDIAIGYKKADAWYESFPLFPKPSIAALNLMGVHIDSLHYDYVIVGESIKFIYPDGLMTLR